MIFPLLEALFVRTLFFGFVIVGNNGVFFQLGIKILHVDRRYMLIILTTVSRQIPILIIHLNLKIPARYLIWGHMIFDLWSTMIIWSSCQSVYGPVIHDVRSFTVRTYYGIHDS